LLPSKQNSTKCSYFFDEIMQQMPLKAVQWLKALQRYTKKGIIHHEMPLFSIL